MKKEVIVILFFIFSVVSSMNSLADEVGCCSNPGAGALTCSADRLTLRDAECCPKPESSFPSYYKSPQNTFSPANYNDCVSNFFAMNKACSTVSACALGCCCSDLGGEIKSEAQCKASGLTFFKGQTDCNQVCAVPQCNDGIDNDNNGCADFEGGDLACTSPADNDESGGSCSEESVGCSDLTYIPKLSDLRITPAKGERKFLLRWKDECSETAISYDVLRCKDSGCTNFAVIGSTNTNSFEDISGDLLFDTIYTYQIKSRYNLQTATPTITSTATLGNLECLNQFSNNNFCIHEPYYNEYKNYLLTNFASIFSKNFADGIKSKFGDKFNKAFFCDVTNKLVPQGTSCSSSQVCVITNNNPSCLNKVNCNYNAANPFGLYYTLQECETDRYCFYDRSHSTVDSCFGCDPSMACYDYKTEAACTRDNCGLGSCKWKNLANQIGIGACVSTNDYNCQWCNTKGTKTLENLRAFNEVFDFCTKEKSNILSEGNYKCYYSGEKSKNCNEVVCKDYSIDQCSSVQITHDENNKIRNPSLDECDIKVCQNIGNTCLKNADGDNTADCTSVSCENDYFVPNTTLLPVIKKGIFDSIIIQIYDRTSTNSSVILKTSGDYTTFLCVEPCDSQGHPYGASTAGRNIIISNLNAFDSTNGKKLLALNEGINVIRYYSQDPAKNIGYVKKIGIESHSNTDGPKILSIDVSGGSKILDKFFTSNQNPTINIQFFEPAVVTSSRIVNKKTGLIVALQGITELSTKASFSVTQTLPNGEYVLELNAKNEKNIFMGTPVSQIIVVDNSKPTLNITPPDGALINFSIATIRLAFDKEVNLEAVKLNSEEIKGMFSTTDNKIFTLTTNLSDGNKKLDVSASDFAKNFVAGFSSFIVDANPTVINLINPRFGASPSFIFDIVIETDNNAVCRFNIDNNLEYEFMDPFPSTGATAHTIQSFDKIPSGDTKNHKLNVKCKDGRDRVVSKSFDINVDVTPPQIKNVFSYPNPIIEKPSTTLLTIEADEPVICKFSTSSREFGVMEGKFENFDNNTFKTINKQAVTLENEGDFLYFVACKNKAELYSDVKEIPVKVDLKIPISIISHTPEFFNSTSAVLAIETNKKSQCIFSETDPAVQNGELFGAPGYSHTKQITANAGRHVFYIKCKDQFLQQWSGVVQIVFTIDLSAPSMTYVDDTSPEDFPPDKTCNTDRLRVKFLGEDRESGIKDYFYTIIKNSQPITSLLMSFSGGEWIWVKNLTLEDNTQYFFKVTAKNLLGLESNPKTSDGVIVDTSLCEQKPFCGDGKIGTGELCDDNGPVYGAINSCNSFNNFIGGYLLCDKCQIDTIGCISQPKCGDKIIQSGEHCDSDVFGAADRCEDLGFQSGTLTCAQNCFLDTSKCTPKPLCGNGLIDPGEDCDGNNLGPVNSQCKQYSNLFTGGTLKCSSNCKIDTNGCFGASGTCGDGIINIGEACDSTNFGSITDCTNYGSFSGGTLSCSAKCQLDTSLCTPKPLCGNGLIDPGEDCDGSNFGIINSSCVSYSRFFTSGALSCNSNCKLDTFGCQEAPKCGNNIIDPGETCDGNLNFTDTNCKSYSPNFIDGNIFCNSCQIKTSSCKTNESSATVTCRSRGDCGFDEACTDNSDCESGFCLNNKCTKSSCDDSVKNQGESSVDCGGPCNKCQDGKTCNIHSDCNSNFCSFGACRPQESCFDGKFSPAESDTDCGGPCPTKCPEGKACDLNEDCENELKCTSSICKKCLDADCRNEQSIQEKDTDGDGLPDEWEIQNGLDPNDPNDADLDSDNDGLMNSEEYNLYVTYGKSTDPNSVDTDNDGVDDKDEVDKGTNPVDPEDFPKSSFTKTLLIILGIVVLLSGFGYLAYRVTTKKQEEKLKLSKQKAIPRTIPQQQFKQIPIKQKEESNIKELLRRKEEQKGKERAKLFEPFGKEEAKKPIEKSEIKEAGEEKKSKGTTKPEKKEPKTQRKTQPKKSKEDVFVKLKEIAQEKKQKKQANPKTQVIQKKQDSIGKLYELAKSKAKKTKK